MSANAAAIGPISRGQGRLLSAGYHNAVGYYRDDTALMQLILDKDGQEQLDRLWHEFDFVADQTERTWTQYFFNQSGEVDGDTMAALSAESGSSGRWATKSPTSS